MSLCTYFHRFWASMVDQIMTFILNKRWNITHCKVIDNWAYFTTSITLFRFYLVKLYLVTVCMVERSTFYMIERLHYFRRTFCVCLRIIYLAIFWKFFVKNILKYICILKKWHFKKLYKLKTKIFLLKKNK